MKKIKRYREPCPSYVSYLSLDKDTVDQSLNLINTESEDLFVCLSLCVCVNAFIS